MPNFNIPADWSSKYPGATLAGDVRFQQFGATDLVPPDIHASIVDGVLLNAAGSSSITLPAAPGGVVVTGSTGGPWTATFSGPLGKTNVAQLTATASLTGGSAPGVTIATTSAGTPSADEVQTITITGSPTGGDFTLTFGGKTTAAIAKGATALQVQAALQALESIGTGGALFYWASFTNLTIDGFTVPPVKFLFQSKAANDTLDLDALQPSLFAAVAAA